MAIFEKKMKKLCMLIVFELVGGQVFLGGSLRWVCVALSLRSSPLKQGDQTVWS